MRRSCRARILKLLFTALAGADLHPSTSVAQEADADAAALAKPENGPAWTLQVQWKFLFPK